MPSDPLLATYAEATEATPVDLTRMRARIRAQGAARRPRWLTLLVPAAGLAVAALVVATVTEPAPAPVAASFDSTGQETFQAGPGVSLTAQGTGVLSGTEQAPRLAWSAGSVEVSVEPGAGLDVQVTTDEAQVRVVGTVFTVDRGPLGTTVGVRRGEVAVDCVNGPQASITAGQTTTCWPTSPVGLLGRAQALRDAGSSTESILTTVEQGLSLHPDSTIHTELSALRVVLLSEGPDPAVAVRAAAEHLARPTAGRRAEIARLGATLGYHLSGCEGASPFISDIPAEEVAASALSMCQTPGVDVDPG